MFNMFRYGVLINVLLIVFNLIPIPPLDGSHVFYYLLPPDLAVRYRAIGGYGIFIVFAILMLGGFRFLWPVVNFFAGLILMFAGVFGRDEMIAAAQPGLLRDPYASTWSASTGRWTCCCT
jgi:Zn-dependent protease